MQQLPNIESGINLNPQVGVLEWFRVGEYQEVENAIKSLKAIGISHLRTGISWADICTEEGEKWYDWLLPRLAKDLTILPCFLYTPPSLGIAPKTSSPPVDPKSYADVLDVIITKHGAHFEWIELWNEANNTSEYDWRLDPEWKIFSEMVGGAAYWAKKRGKKTVLSGMSPIDPHWLELMFTRGVMNYIDAVGIHGFPDTFDTSWEGWDENVRKIKEVLDRHNCGAELWITEAGFSTWQHDERRQTEEFLQVTSLPVDRVYWYSLKDIDPSLPTVDGFHLDEREYHFGLKHHDGTPKLLYRLLQKGGVKAVREHGWVAKRNKATTEKHILITGGAGFIGTNVARQYLLLGKPVTIFDNLSRAGVEDNLAWLKRTYGKDVHIQIADIRNEHAVTKAVQNAEQVFHFAAQVAVTTSLVNPTMDFEVNAAGTLNLLKAMHKMQSPPSLVFTSTNKVYGGLYDLPLQETDEMYLPSDEDIRKNGICEKRNLDFHSPYGCSKGTADQYVIDYARTFDLPASVFRMSCIYGPHQYGTEDQGWVAHFVINALSGAPITLYGDGKQVRDLLFVEDLVDAFILAQKNMDKIAGQAFNIGGGPDNAVSILNVVRRIQEIQGKEIPISYGEWRPGDQRYYVSDTRKFEVVTGWSRKTNVQQGLTKLYEWLQNERFVPAAAEQVKLTA